MSTPNTSASKTASLQHENHRTWTRDGFLISTDPSLIEVQSLSDAFAQEWMYWAKPLPHSAMMAMIQNSLNFGLYTTNAAPISKIDEPPSISEPNPKDRKMIGYARVITDNVTFSYLTDVYVLPEYQGSGLGKWLIECVQEVFEGLPYLRRTFLVTGTEGPAVGFYEKMMGMEKLEEGSGGKLVVMSWQGPGSNFLKWKGNLDGKYE
jgi:ribosomal protein S18 acetylase RimI-like enzyme